jgi:hypothetical protein
LQGIALYLHSGGRKLLVLAKKVRVRVMLKAGDPFSLDELRMPDIEFESLQSA